MLRRVSKEKYPVKKASDCFSMSRQNFYKVKDAFEQKGMTGLLPGKRGPKRAHKITEDIIRFIKTIVEQTPTLTKDQIAQKIEEDFNLVIHPRTIGRVLRGQKNGRKG